MPNHKLSRAGRRAVFLGAVASVLLVAPIAQARVKVRLRGAGLPGRGSYGPDILRPEQLEQCLRVEKDINAGADRMEASEASLNQQSAEIDKLGKELDRSAAQLDRTSQYAVDTYNAKARRYQVVARDHDAQVATFNSNVRTHNSQIDQFNANCASKKYYESDMQAARSKIGS